MIMRKWVSKEELKEMLPETKHWSEIEEGHQELIDILNETYWVQYDGTCLREKEFCEKCKNELISCVCMEVDND